MTAPSAPDASDAGALAPFANLALACVHREYPNHLSHAMRSDADASPPRRLHPAFYGAFDWHSSVHGHWSLARLARLHEGAVFAEAARAALARTLTHANLESELHYMESRPAFERPYGLAWLLQLEAELAAWDDPDARRWSEALAPLASVCAERLGGWFAILPRPVRSGVHSQSAFAMGLALDRARVVGDAAANDLAARARDLHGDDRDLPLHLEPSGEDFLSPSLGAADLIRRVLPPNDFAMWLTRALPGIPHEGTADWLAPLPSPDRADGRLAHLDGLTLSRAFMLEGIAAGLPGSDPRLPALGAAARVHRRLGIAAVDDRHYEGAHWLGTFAVYLLTARGLGAPVRRDPDRA